jgi:hypothetical protein
MPTTRPRSSLRLKKPTPKAAALNTPPKAKAPSSTITPSKRQPNSDAASATPNKKPRRGLQHFELKRKSDKKKPRVARELLEPELEPEPKPEDEKGSESGSSDDEQEETSDESEESEESDDKEESNESAIEVQQPKSKAQRYAQRPEREQTLLEFVATVSDDDDDEQSIDTDDELNNRFNESGYQFESNSDAPLLLFNFIKGDDNSNYLHGHTFILGESILDVHPKTKLKDAARKLDQYIRNNGIRATEINPNIPPYLLTMQH